MPFLDYIIGGIAGCTSRTATAPLELYKLQAQNRYIPHSTINAVLKKESFLHLWKGNGANCIRLFPQHAISYGIFNSSKNYLQNYTDNKNIINFISGLLGGITAMTSIYPLETIRSRLSLQTCNSHYYGITDCFKKMGWREMYQGLGTSMMGFAPYTALSFMFFFQYKKHIYLEENIKKLVCGGLSGISAVTITYPTDLIRRRLQLQGFDKSVPKYNGIRDCIKKILRRDGIRGLYRGLGACYIKLFPTVGIQFWTIEKCNDLLKI